MYVCVYACLSVQSVIQAMLHEFTHEWTTRAQWLFIAPFTLQQHVRGGGRVVPTMHCAPQQHGTNVVWQPNKEEAIGIQTLWRLEMTSEEQAGIPYNVAVTAGGHRQQRRMDALAFGDTSPRCWWSLQICFFRIPHSFVSVYQCFLIIGKTYFDLALMS